MHFNDNYETLASELKATLGQYTGALVFGREAILHNNEKAKMQFLSLADTELESRLDKDLVTGIESFAKKTLDTPLQTRSLNFVQQTSDLLLLLLDKVIKKEITKWELKRIYTFLIHQNIHFGTVQEAEDLLSYVKTQVNPTVGDEQ